MGAVHARLAGGAHDLAARGDDLRMQLAICVEELALVGEACLQRLFTGRHFVGVQLADLCEN